VVLEPRVYEKLKPRNVEQVLFDLDKRIEEILTSKLLRTKKLNCATKLCKNRGYTKRKNAPKTLEKKNSVQSRPF